MPWTFDQAALLLTRRGGFELNLSVADDAWGRARGLIGVRLPLHGSERSQGLLLEGCRAVHGCFMRGSLDLVYLDCAGQVTQTARLVPWAMHLARARDGRHPIKVLELPAGVVASWGVAAGDWLLLPGAARPQSAIGLSLLLNKVGLQGQGS